MSIDAKAIIRKRIEALRSAENAAEVEYKSGMAKWSAIHTARVELDDTLAEIEREEKRL